MDTLTHQFSELMEMGRSLCIDPDENLPHSCSRDWSPESGVWSLQRRSFILLGISLSGLEELVQP